MHDLKTHKSHHWEIQSHAQSRVQKAVCSKSACEAWLNTNHKEKVGVAYKLWENMQIDAIFSAKLHHFIANENPITALPFDWMELPHLAEWLGLWCHAEMQPGNPYVSHRQHDKGGEGMITFLSCWNHLDQELWMNGKGWKDKCSKLCWMILFLFGLVSASIFFVGVHAEMLWDCRWLCWWD